MKEGAKPGPAHQVWPNPPEWPLYVSVERAAKIAGVTYEAMSEWANDRADPIPHIPVGRAKKLIRVAAIPEYAMKKEA